MKLQASELPLGKPQTRRRTPKFAPLVALTVLLTIPLYYPSIKESHRKISEAWHLYEYLEDSVTPNIDLDPPPKEYNQDCSLEVYTQRCNPSEGGAAVEPTITKRDNVDVETTPKFNENEPEAKNLKEENQITKATSKLNEEESEAKNLLEENQETNPLPPPSSFKGEMTAHHEKVARKRTERDRRKKSRRSSPTYLTPPKVSEEKLKRASSSNNNNDRSMVRSEVLDYENCDLFSGEWVPNPEGPYYTNMTCDAIQEHQNCMRFGRPDEGFLEWRWKPDACELPIFDPDQFLELVRGKSIAFVGDSVARNHMQSLICLLSRVVYPLDLSDPTDQNKRYKYSDHNFNISMFWSPYLVKTEKTNPNDVTRPFKLFLDEFDEHWATQIQYFDYVIISAGHWFFRPTYFYLNHRLVGCLYCPEDNISHLTSYFSYRRAFRTAFRAINDANNPKGVTYLRTFAPSHFEGGPWDKGGDCARTRPFKRNETVLEDFSLEMYMIQLEELRIAQKAARRNGVKIRLFDATKPMLLRPDGHPSKYGHWPVPNVTLISDCVHWCLPGPIDSWNDFLQELMKREIQNDR
ncbi:protein trichome birefringence-like 19 [Olea europaea var. sylvestris]|uniref:Trichome birefringence-like 19 n=1 Tax=Olea europaea subsp. europaea TaxID=158383 RepID=A0A8S0Q6E8_OLEEU|nr:protein trichome birefringence-like 19 [Olea europaea var. sylvestris]CAA2961495.1 trichome birefringence-like 19 [Olea europaea subsp. europaea]